MLGKTDVPIYIYYEIVLINVGVYGNCITYILITDFEVARVGGRRAEIL